MSFSSKLSTVNGGVTGVSKFVVSQAEVLVTWVPHLQLVPQGSLMGLCPYSVGSVLTLDNVILN